MAEKIVTGFFLPAMSDQVYKRLASFLQENLGIKLPLAKKVMLQSRVMKRLKALSLKTYEQYCDFLFSAQGAREELNHLFDVTTTNKTDFFREPVHFDFLTTQVLPELETRGPFSTERPFLVWSAGCSTGEEPYTLAIVLSEYAADHPSFNFRILASDISTRVLDIARRAVYAEEKIGCIPLSLRRKYLLKSRDWERGEVRITPALRARVHFFRFNLMEEHYALPAKPDVIFCRNVFIYFERETQTKLLHQFHKVLRHHGFLFSGHSETFCNLNVPFMQVVPTVYRKIERRKAPDGV